MFKKQTNFSSHLPIVLVFFFFLNKTVKLACSNELVKDNFEFTVLRYFFLLLKKLTSNIVFRLIFIFIKNETFIWWIYHFTLRGCRHATGHAVMCVMHQCMHLHHTLLYILFTLLKYGKKCNIYFTILFTLI